MQTRASLTQDLQPSSPSEKPSSEPIGSIDGGKSTKLSSMSSLVIVPHPTEFAQIEAYLQLQLQKCAYYKKIFEGQSNLSLAAKFETFHSITLRDLELLQRCWREGKGVPKFKFEPAKVTCVPTNVEMKERELHLVIKASNLPVADNSVTYVIAEFQFPLTGKEETIAESTGRWVRNVKIDPKNLMCCSGSDDPPQLDMVFSVSSKPFYDPNSNMVEYERPIKFFIDKGRSRTLKRKFKPIKLTFFEKTASIRCDKKIGTVNVKIDDINDEASLIVRSTIMNGRRSTNAVTDIKVRVREPLVDKTLKTYEEKLLVLT